MVECVPGIILRPIRSSGSTEGALEEAGRAEQHITTEAAPNELKLGEGAQSDESGPSARWSRRGCSSEIMRKPPCRFGPSVRRRTHTRTGNHLSNIRRRSL